MLAGCWTPNISEIRLRSQADHDGMTPTRPSPMWSAVTKFLGGDQRTETAAHAPCRTRSCAWSAARQADRPGDGFSERPWEIGCRRLYPSSARSGQHDNRGRLVGKPAKARQSSQVADQRSAPLVAERGTSKWRRTGRFSVHCHCTMAILLFMDAWGASTAFSRSFVALSCHAHGISAAYTIR